MLHSEYDACVMSPGVGGVYHGDWPPGPLCLGQRHTPRGAVFHHHPAHQWPRVAQEHPHQARLKLHPGSHQPGPAAFHPPG